MIRNGRIVDTIFCFLSIPKCPCIEILPVKWKGRKDLGFWRGAAAKKNSVPALRWSKQKFETLTKSPWRSDEKKKEERRISHWFIRSIIGVSVTTVTYQLCVPTAWMYRLVIIRFCVLEESKPKTDVFIAEYNLWHLTRAKDATLWTINVLYDHASIGDYSTYVPIYTTAICNTLSSTTRSHTNWV